MRIVKRDDCVMDVPKQYRKQYANYDRNYRFSNNKTGLTLGETVAALDAATTVAEIRAILPHWCALECDECGEDVEQVIRFGEEPDYEARWQDLCAACVAKAAEALAKPNI